MEDQCHALAGTRFNLASAKQVSVFIALPINKYLFCNIAILFLGQVKRIKVKS